MNFRRSPTSVEILTIIATSTEVPRDISKHMIGSSRTIEDNFRFLLNEKYISKIKPAKSVASFRLTQKGKKVLCDAYVTGGKSKMFEDFLSNRAPELCGNQKQIYRLHRQSEVIVACHNAGIQSYVGEKPFLSENAIEDKNFPLRRSDSSRFFNSQELKKSFPTQDKFASASRVIGTIVTPENLFFVYNTNKYPINFSVDQERKAYKIFCEAIIKNGYIPLSIIPKISEALLRNSEALYREAEVYQQGTPLQNYVSGTAKPKCIADAKPKCIADAKPKCIADAKPKCIADAKPKCIADAKPTSVQQGTPPQSYVSGTPAKLFIKDYCLNNVLAISPHASQNHAAASQNHALVDASQNEATTFTPSNPYYPNIEKAIEKWVIGYCNENKNAIILGHDWNAAREMLKESNNYLAKTLIQPKNTAYNTMRYIPNTREGEMTLKIITQHAWKERILAVTVPPENISKEKPYGIGCDLYTKDKIACYCLIDMDLTRLIDMKRWLENREGEKAGYKMKILCFGYQTEFLKEWFGRQIDKGSYIEIPIERAMEAMEYTAKYFGEWEEAKEKTRKEIERIFG